MCAPQSRDGIAGADVPQCERSRVSQKPAGVRARQQSRACSGGCCCCCHPRGASVTSNVPWTPNMSAHTIPCVGAGEALAPPPSHSFRYFVRVLEPLCTRRLHPSASAKVRSGRLLNSTRQLCRRLYLAAAVHTAAGAEACTCACILWQLCSAHRSLVAASSIRACALRPPLKSGLLPAPPIPTARAPAGLHSSIGKAASRRVQAAPSRLSQLKPPAWPLPPAWPPSPC